MALRNARPKRVALAIAALTTCLAAVSGAAWASSTPSTETLTTLDGKARFKGHYTAYSADENHGGVLVGGDLTDLNKTNHRSVKFQYDPQATVTSYAQYQVCQVNTILPDNCFDSEILSNPYAPHS